MALIEKLTAIANGFRSSRGITEKLSLDEMATLAAETSNKLPQFFNKTITELTTSDLEGVTSIPDNAFEYCSSLTSVTIPNSVTSIGKYTFRDCVSLTSLTIPDSVHSIGNSAFSSCESLTSVTIPDSVTSFGTNVFENCADLTSATIGNGVTSLGSATFYGCESLTSITIPDSVTSIGWGALQIGLHNNKATITFLGTTPASLNASAFDTSKLNKIIVPAGTREAYINATNWANFANYIEEAAA